jgi:large subunit ribosomal protein L10
VAAAKALVDQARRHPALEIRGGYAEGRILGAEDIRALASLESRDVMLARIAGLAMGEIARTAWLMQALQSKFVALMGALKDKLPAAEEPAAKEPAEEPAAEAAAAEPPAEQEGD